MQAQLLVSDEDLQNGALQSNCVESIVPAGGDLRDEDRTGLLSAVLDPGRLASLPRAAACGRLRTLIKNGGSEEVGPLAARNEGPPQLGQ